MSIHFERTVFIAEQVCSKKEAGNRGNGPWVEAIPEENNRRSVPLLF